MSKKKLIKHEAINRRAIRTISRKILRSPTLSIADIFAYEADQEPTFNKQVDFRRIPFEVDNQLHEIYKEFRLDRLT